MYIIGGKESSFYKNPFSPPKIFPPLAAPFRWLLFWLVFLPSLPSVNGFSGRGFHECALAFIRKTLRKKNDTGLDNKAPLRLNRAYILKRIKEDKEDGDLAYSRAMNWFMRVLSLNKYTGKEPPAEYTMAPDTRNGLC